MLDTAKALKFLELFSIITVGENKIPNFSWKLCQTKRLNKSQFIDQYEYRCGKFRKDGKELPATTNFGIVTGFEDLECIDIDLKVLPTAKEQKDFWEEYIGYLKDNIYDFEEKLVIYKTRNSGYHILYKSKQVQVNLKIAKLKGNTEAIIETRGIGGYIFAYPDNKVSKKSYFDIDYITDDEREIIMSFSRMYDYIEPIEEAPEIKKIRNEIQSEVEITSWDDFNSKNDVWDIVCGEFSIVGNHKNKTVIKRHGSSSPHSGYIYKDENLMYLFSTGTIYPHEKQINPFTAYTYKYHNGDFKESCRDIYEKGFGSRLIKKEKEPKLKEPIENIINDDDLIFPINIFPEPLQAYILECNSTLSSSIDYMGCSLLWVASICIGNSMKVEVKKGWKESSTMWFSLVGKAGIGKTPSISNIIFPLEKINNKEISKYITEYEKYDAYMKLSAKEKKDVAEVLKPRKSQFIANDITVEALVDLHQENDNAVGVFKDELAGWLKDMNKYKQGSDLEFWLSCWSGKAVNLNRITRAGSFVSSPNISVIGGIQPTIFNTFYTEENKDNGFMDRMLLSFPDLNVEMYNENEMNEDTIQWYSDTIVSFFETIKNKLVKRDRDGKIESIVVKFSQEAKQEWIRIFNEITVIQNSDAENEYMKSMLPKQKSYIPRFSLLIHSLNAIGNHNYNMEEISKESILKAETLSKYFIAMSKKIKIESIETNNIKSHTVSTSSNEEAVAKMFDQNPDFNRSKAAEILGISRMQVLNLLKKAKQNETKVKPIYNDLQM